MEQDFALNDELWTVKGLTEYGLASLQSTDAGNDFYHLPSLLLSSALERLCKCALILRAHELTAAPPALKDFGHDLRRLVDTVISCCFTTAYLTRPVAAEDRRFLSSDRWFREILAILRNFASGGRYYELDVASQRPFASDTSPSSMWHTFESMVMRDLEVWDQVAVPGQAADPAFATTIRAIVATFERAFRALARLFTLGPLGHAGRQFQGPLHPWLMLKDEELGTRDYRA